MVRRYVEKMTGLSRAQTTRLITMYSRGEEVKPQPYRRRSFPQRYTREDIALLAGVDEAHQILSGPATKKLLQRACYNFSDRRYQSLARISVAHLTGCGVAVRTVSGASSIRRRDRHRYPSESGGSRIRKAVRDTCASTPVRCVVCVGDAAPHRP